MSRSVKPLPKWLMLFVRLNWCIGAFALSFPLGLLATTCVMRFVLSVICSYHIVSLWLPVYLCDSCFILSNLTRFYLYRTWRTEREEWWEGGKWKGERRSRRSVPPSWNHPCPPLPCSTLDHASLVNIRDLKIWGRRRHRKRLLKVNLRALNLHADYSKSLTLWNVGELSCSWIPQNHIQDKKWREKFRSCLFTSSIKRETRHFHIVAVQWRQRNVQHCVFNLLLIWSCRCRRSILRFV